MQNVWADLNVLTLRTSWGKYGLLVLPFTHEAVGTASVESLETEVHRREVPRALLPVKYGEE